MRFFPMDTMQILLKKEKFDICGTKVYNILIKDFKRDRNEKKNEAHRYSN